MKHVAHTGDENEDGRAQIALLAVEVEHERPDQLQVHVLRAPHRQPLERALGQLRTFVPEPGLQVLQVGRVHLKIKENLFSDPPGPDPDS